jgi:hypothetical protein
MRRKASGSGGLARGMMRANDAFGQAMPGTIGEMTRQMGGNWGRFELGPTRRFCSDSPRESDVVLPTHRGPPDLTRCAHQPKLTPRRQYEWLR